MRPLRKWGSHDCGKVGRLESNWHSCVPISDSKREAIGKAMALYRVDPALTHRVNPAIVLYAAFSLLDFGFTLAIFAVGGCEANPVLRWFALHGLFEFAKIASTLLVCCIAFKLWDRKLAQSILHLGNAIMACVLVYHVSIWTVLIQSAQ